MYYRKIDIRFLTKCDILLCSINIIYLIINIAIKSNKLNLNLQYENIQNKLDKTLLNKTFYVVLQRLPIPKMFGFINIWCRIMTGFIRVFKNQLYIPVIFAYFKIPKQEKKNLQYYQN